VTFAARCVGGGEVLVRAFSDGGSSPPERSTLGAGKVPLGLPSLRRVGVALASAGLRVGLLLAGCRPG